MGGAHVPAEGQASDERVSAMAQLAQVQGTERVAAEDGYALLEADCVQVAIRPGVRHRQAESLGQPDVGFQCRGTRNLLEQDDVCFFCFDQFSERLEPLGPPLLARPVVPQVGTDHGEGPEMRASSRPVR